MRGHVPIPQKWWQILDERDKLLAENQRLREALQRIEDGVYVAQGQPAAAYMQKVAREALAGDGE